MEIGSGSSSINSLAANALVQTRTRQLEQDQQTQDAQQTQRSQQAEQAQQTQQTEQAQQAQALQAANDSESVRQAQSETEKNRPTVNTSGQLVGTRINTTA